MNSSDKIITQINELQDWRHDILLELRELINQTIPLAVESIKWGVPVWGHNGLICSISTFKDHVKINFFKGAYLDDPKGLFNSGLDSKEHRSINFSENDKLNKPAIKKLILAAITYNQR